MQKRNGDYITAKVQQQRKEYRIKKTFFQI